MKIASIIIPLLPFLLSSKKADAVIATHKSINSLVIDSQIPITDSLFIGEPLVKNAEFIRNTESLGNNFQYFEKFEALLKKHNRKYANYKSNGFIKAFKVSEQLTLELKRKSYTSKNKNSDIQVVLYTKINNVLKDSILFYKYQLDKDFPKDQRFESLAFLDDNLELFKLESYSGLSELAFQADKWEKFKINSTNGKIDFVEKLNYRETTNQDNNTEEYAQAIALPVNGEESEAAYNLRLENVKSWEGNYTISIKGEKLEDGSVSGRTWKFSMKNGWVTLVTESYHEPVFCDGNYLWEAIGENTLHLYYNGPIENCKSSQPSFTIKKEKGKYIISSPDFYSDKKKWLTLHKEK